MKDPAAPEVNPAVIMGGSQLYCVDAGTTPFVPFTGITVNETPVQVALAMVLILGVG